VRRFIFLKRFDHVQKLGPPEAHRETKWQWPDIMPVVWWNVQHLSFLQNTFLVNSWWKFRKLHKIWVLDINLKQIQTHVYFVTSSEIAEVKKFLSLLWRFAKWNKSRGENIGCHHRNCGKISHRDYQFEILLLLAPVGRGTPDNGLYGQILLKRGTFCWLQIGIWQVEAYQRVRKTVIQFFQRAFN